MCQQHYNYVIKILNLDVICFNVIIIDHACSRDIGSSIHDNLTVNGIYIYIVDK